jgi:hypothetical protein
MTSLFDTFNPVAVKTEQLHVGTLTHEESYHSRV